MRQTLWFNLRILALGLLLAFSYSGEAIAHGIAHHREQEDRPQHHSHFEFDGLTGEVDIRDVSHVDQVLAFSEVPRLRIGTLPVMVHLTVRATFMCVKNVVQTSTTDVDIHPRRGPPPRLRAPPAA